MIDQNVRLDRLGRFLEHVVQAAVQELKGVERRNEGEGEFPEFGDYEYALSCPVSRVEIASRAVFYEVTALIEHSIYSVARRPWLESHSRKGPKTLADLETPISDSLPSLRLVTDLRFADVIALVEGYYEITLSTLPAWDVLSKVRDSVNSFKHNNGYVDFRKIPFEDIRIGEIQMATDDQARAAIDAARTFLSALRKATHAVESRDGGRG